MFKSGHSRWTQLIGNLVADTKMIKATYFRGTLYAAVASKTGQYSGGDITVPDVTVAALESETGFIRVRNVFGGPKATYLKDIVSCHMGIYMLMQISGQFNPHPVSGNSYVYDDSVVKLKDALVWTNLDVEIFQLVVIFV
jgi:hypothetical protein